MPSEPASWSAADVVVVPVSGEAAGRGREGCPGDEGLADLGKPFVWSRQWRRALMIHDSDRSTTQGRGSTTKPFVFGGRRTGLIVRSSCIFAQVTREPA